MREQVRRWLPLVTFATLLLPAAEAFCQPAAGADPLDARGWLARIHSAAHQRNYQGTLVFSAGGALSSSRVAHFCVGDQSYERLETLDGRQQRIYRQNDSLHTVWPQSRVVVQEKAGAMSSLPSSTQVVEPRALDRYELKSEGSDRVAGREAQVFLLQPRDEMRYSQRLWADKSTGLMLRADVIGAKNQVLESTAFSEVEIGIKPQPDPILQAMKKQDGYRVVRPQQQRTQLEAEGWALDKPVPGFVFAGCMKRSVESPDAAVSDPVLQVVYSDGATHVSLFIEPYDAKRAVVPLAGQLGATATLRQKRGEHWITVMGDVPSATLKAFAEALERRR